MGVKQYGDRLFQLNNLKRKIVDELFLDQSSSFPLPLFTLHHLYRIIYLLKTHRIVFAFLLLLFCRILLLPIFSAFLEQQHQDPQYQY